MIEDLGLKRDEPKPGIYLFLARTVVGQLGDQIETACVGHSGSLIRPILAAHRIFWAVCPRLPLPHG